VIRWIAGGLVLAVVTTFTIVMIIGVLAVDRNDVTDLDVGVCFDLPVGESDGEGFAEIGTVETVDCDEPHTAQVVAVGDLNPDRDRVYPGEVALVAEVDEWCAQIEPDPRFGVVPIVPTESTWNGRDGRYVCVALTFGIVPVTGDHAAVER
jgi:hypothetical protein